MARIILVEVKAINTDKPFAYDETKMITLARNQFNLDSPGFTDAIINKTIKKLAEEIVDLRHGNVE